VVKCVKTRSVEVSIMENLNLLVLAAMQHNHTILLFDLVKLNGKHSVIIMPKFLPLTDLNLPLTNNRCNRLSSNLSRYGFLMALFVLISR
jgi:hypothetical protein